jgi:hypothetical protein
MLSKSKNDNAPAWNNKWSVSQRDRQLKKKPIRIVEPPIFGPTPNGWAEYFAQNHDPKIVFNPQNAGRTYQQRDYVVPQLDAETDGKTPCRFCGKDFATRTKCREHMWTDHRAECERIWGKDRAAA